MINFGGITHVIENPKGHAPGYNFSLVGSVPTTMLDGRTPTMFDVMGGRVQPDGKAYHGRQWTTVGAILTAAKANDVQMCDSFTCACRQYFSRDWRMLYD